MLIEETIKTGTVYLAPMIEAIAAIIITIASAKALYNYLLMIFQRSNQKFTKAELRLSFGSTLAISLEFLLAADILKTAVAPSWNDIGQLAAIAVLRTALNYFLEKELQGVEENRSKLTESKQSSKGYFIEKALI